MKENIGTYTNNSYHTIYCKYSLTEIDDPASEGSWIIGCTSEFTKIFEVKRHVVF